MQGHDLHLLRLFAYKIQILPQAHPIKQPFPCLALFAERPEQGIAGRRFGEQRGEELGGVQMGGQRGRPCLPKLFGQGRGQLGHIHVEAAGAFRRGKGTLEAQPRQFKDEGGGRSPEKGAVSGAEQGTPRRSRAVFRGGMSAFMRTSTATSPGLHGVASVASRRRESSNVWDVPPRRSAT